MIYDYVYIIWLIASDVYTRTFNATCAVSRLTAGKCKLLGAWLAPWPRPKGRAGWRGSQHQGVFKRQRLAQAFGARWLPASLTWRSGELTWDSPVKKWPRLCHLGGQPKIWPVLRAREVSPFLGAHGPSSDGYYDYFVNRDMGPENGLYHVCDCEASRCRVRKARGDRSELIHVDRWRLQTPATMMESPYLAHLGADLGEKALSTAAREKKAAVPIGSGLDAALLGEAGPGGEEMEVDKRSRKRSRSPRGEQGSMGRYLTQQAVKQGETKAASQKKRKRSSPKRKKKKRQSSSSSSEKSESSSFQLAPARGGELWRAAQKKLGRLTRLGLDEMTRYLADRADDIEADQRWKGQKITAYLHQVLLVTNPPQKIGLRMLRELQTIAVTLDHLLSGRLPQATDTLMQRLKACEMSLTEGGWTTARHLEITPSSASLVQAEERELAAKQEIRSLKLKESMKRASK